MESLLASSNNNNQKCSVISNDELDMLFDRVLIRLPYFREIGYSEDVWDRSLPYLEELISHHNPSIVVSRIKNKLRLIKEDDRPRGWNYSVQRSSIISIQLYIILNYIFSDNEEYVKNVILQLKEMLGFFSGNQCPLRLTHDLLDSLPKRNATTNITTKIVDSSALEKEKEIIDLRTENSRLSAENAKLREELALQEEEMIVDPNEEQVIFEVGQGKNIRHVNITARKVANKIKDSGLLMKLQKKEWEKILSLITTLDESTFHSHL